MSLYVVFTIQMDCVIENLQSFTHTHIHTQNRNHVASQMWLLGRLLPLMIGEYVPDDDPHWICYIDLLSILVLSTATEVSIDTITDLKSAIESYLFKYNRLAIP